MSVTRNIKVVHYKTPAADRGFVWCGLKYTKTMQVTTVRDKVTCKRCRSTFLEKKDGI